MIDFYHNIRVRYDEVDRMDFLYHAHYVAYFDVARTEMIRALGCPNVEMEIEGVMIPVINVNINYGKPAHYDEVLTIRTMIKAIPTSRAIFHYEVYREKEMLTTGSVTVGFMNAETRKACRPPKKLYDVVVQQLKEGKEHPQGCKTIEPFVAIQ